jgi:hypothetical protein
MVCAGTDNFSTVFIVIVYSEMDFTYWLEMAKSVFLTSIIKSNKRMIA